MLGLQSSAARAEVDRPRFVIILDNSSSMTDDLSGRPTHGDGSEAQPGCDLDGQTTSGWRYDDSKIFQAKSAIIDTISAFGSAEFSLAVYARTMLGQACSSNADCDRIAAGSTCEDLPDDASAQKYCVHHAGATYLECASCGNCANNADANDRLFEWRQLDCTSSTCSYSATCPGAQVVVGFPKSGSNYYDIYRWIDGKEDQPPFGPNSNREVRAEAFTPIAGSLRSVREWLTDPSKTNVGDGAGLLSNDPAARDPRASCRPYGIILVTDGEESCSPDPNDAVRAATEAWNAGIPVYVVGFGTGYVGTLDSIAKAGSGSKQSAYFAKNRAQLAASLGGILMGAISTPRCNCNAACYDEAAAFPLKGKPCFVGKGRCRRQGVYACNGTGDGVVCAQAAGCGVAALAAGAPQQEVCGTSPGCQAPTPEDCADENCDGQIDEGLSCACKPEICNGLDDDCNGVVDDVASVPCGLETGECRAGTTACVSDGAGGKKTVCQGGVAAQPELCDGKDNNCDGIIDGMSQTCFPAGALGCAWDEPSGKWVCNGTCQTGQQICTTGAWQSCVGAVTPVEEIACDGKDNDCDGQVDETNPAPDQRCYPAGVAGCDLTTGVCKGVCTLGHLGCQTNPVSGRSELGCVGTVTPQAELCNGKDDNCDGQIDETFPNLGKPCNEGSCQGAGKLVCNEQGTDVVCTVSSTGPTPEVCDGIDNDCDGKIDNGAMPGVGVVCGSAVGECRTDTSACVNGRIVCNDVKPTVEICNGKDDDCNGTVDDNVVPPADSCNPAGMDAGTPLQGECRSGRFVCKGAEGWLCSGGQGPAPEVCDGKDNDCDGVIDNAAPCEVGKVCYEGACVPRCTADEQPCTADRYCKNGVCLLKECVLKPCAAGRMCNGDGKCIDPCAGVSCLPGATCERGMCQDCYSRGCLAGQLCHKRTCEADPCLAVTCNPNQYCAGGTCVENCATLHCPAGQSCRVGVCVADRCADVECGYGQFCDPATGVCRYKPCSGLSCIAGTVCVEATGTCASNPCETVRCQGSDVCKVLPDGQPDCQPPGGQEPVVAQVRVVGRDGCSMAPGARATGPGLLFVLGLLALRRRRRV